MVCYDQLHRAVTLKAIPKRIISLVPSQTELLHSLGLKEEVVGITKFCIHPREWFDKKVRVGGTKKLHLELIRELQPDLIIGNKEENDREQLEALMQSFPVWVSDINNLSAALEMILALGDITARQESAQILAGKIKRGFEELGAEWQPLLKNRPRLSVAYLIWQKPWMVAGKDTFIHNMLTCCGLDNCFSDEKRYPEISLTQLRERNCDLVLLSSEPFPFQEKHAAEIRRQLPEIRIIFVDGELFSWYGSRLLKAPKYFKEILKQVYL